MTIRLRLDISYDGGDFAGWAAQPDQRTVQAVVEDALATVLRIPPARLVVAGRTDTGVHALGQVAHVDVPSGAYQHAAAKLVRRLAGVLPPDVRVRDVTPVSQDFDARFSALWRRYRYRISDSEFGAGPLSRRDTASWRRRLDAPSMAAAAGPLLGLHDFAAFCRRRDGSTTIRQLQRLEVGRVGDLVTVDVQADAFCHSMVRSLVGALAAVGEGHRPADWLAGLLSRAERADEITVAPARGLTLVEVGYPAAGGLAARAGQTRTVRTIAPTVRPPAVAPAADPAHGAARERSTGPSTRLIDLSVLIETGMPVCDGDPLVAVNADLSIAEHGVNVARVHMGSQTGTHVDAPNHVLETGLTLDEVPLERFLGQCVVADLRGLADQEPITVALLQGVRALLRPGRIVLLCTGWSEHWGSDRYLAHPFLAPDAAELLLAEGIRTVGIDALSVDPSPAAQELPAHQLIAAAGGVIIENLRRLGELVELPPGSVELMALPLRLDAVDGAPVRAVAAVAATR